jgi:hypothetical protein
VFKEFKVLRVFREAKVPRVGKVSLELEPKVLKDGKVHKEHKAVKVFKEFRALKADKG